MIKFDDVFLDHLFSCPVAQYDKPPKFNYYLFQVHLHHLIIYTLVVLILSQGCLHSAGVQLPPTVLLSITTS